MRSPKKIGGISWLTAMGLDSVRITSEESFNVRDMANWTGVGERRRIMSLQKERIL